MRIERGRLEELAPVADSVLTMGSFDGVHIAHQALVGRVVEVARQRGLEASLMTFEPHPREVLVDDAPPVLRLTSLEEKLRLLGELGLDRVLLVRFTPELADWDAGRFLREGLIRRVGLRHLVVGPNHGFGRGRSGDTSFLARQSTELGFGLDVLDPVALDGAPVSSTRVRRALIEGRVEQAARLLGRPAQLAGAVVEGDRRGRELGFPTANLCVDPGLLLPKDGVYAVRAHLADGRRVGGMLNLGPRPTFGDPVSRPEIHLFDFAEDLYGQPLRVDVLLFVRDTMRFNSGKQLMEQLQEDRQRIQEWLEAQDANG